LIDSFDLFLADFQYLHTKLNELLQKALPNLWSSRADYRKSIPL
jgi:hypothetical protein